MNRIHEFNAYRSKMNDRILATNHLGIKRFFNLDSSAYEDGELDKKTKEMMGLVASMVLRCNDCIDYHVLECINCGVTNQEFDEIFNISLVVGGSIVIPHLRHAYETLDLAKASASKN